MQVNAISNGTFTGKRDNIEGFINLSDSDIRQLAYSKTMSKADTRKYKKTDRALTLLLPVAGGLSSAAYAAKGGRKLAFAKGFGGWTAFLLGIGAVFGLDKALKNKSEKYRNFAEKHGVLNMLGTMTAAYFAGLGLIKGGAKAVKTLMNTGVYKTVAGNVSKTANKLASKGFVNNVITKTSSFFSKTPSALKSVAKVGAKLAPWVLIFGSLFHSIGFSTKIAKDANQNYTYLKDKQLNLANALRREAEVQRDYLATNPDNAEDLADLKNETNL